MKDMKKYFKYVILFIVAYFLVTFLSNAIITTPPIDIKCNVEENEKFEIQIEKSKNGYIDGTVTNNSGELIDKVYLRIIVYEKNDKYYTTLYKEINYFNVGEKTRFEIDLDNKNIEEVTFSVVDKIPDDTQVKENNSSESNVFDSIIGNYERDKETLAIAVPIGIVLGLMCIIP